MNILRCAIYTRKSSDEGLEQEFNSLDAQREACEAYITSQKHEGWKPLSNRYDDGGFSGGNMDRPGLKQLLADIEAKKINVVVVYKVDRLTRSLADFAKIVEQFDGKGVSFVSVTQQFNTTSSMGRLTLNVLLSFAQFEREVTGERIRDKIAASKKKGMWMGGVIPLGYDAKDRKLIVNPKEAELVRHIYERYLVLKSVHDLADELNAAGYKTKSRSHLQGRARGGGRFWHGPLYTMLQNSLYCGIISHKGEQHQGQHEAIVGPDLWSAAQKIMQDNRLSYRSKENAKHRSLLSGIIYHADGQRLTPTHSNKDGRRYGYYVTLRGRDYAQGKNSYRISSGYFDELICRELAKFLRNEKRIIEASGCEASDVRKVHQLIDASRSLATHLEKKPPGAHYELIRNILGKVTIADDAITLNFTHDWKHNLFPKLVEEETDEHEGSIQLEIKTRVIRAGIEKRIVLADDAYTEQLEVNETLKRALIKGFIWREQLLGENPMSLEMIAQANGVAPTYVSMLVDLSFMSPKIVEAILRDQVPIDLTLQGLVGRLVIEWRSQEALIYQAKNLDSGLAM